MSSRRAVRAQREADEARGVDTRTGEVLPYSCPPELRRCIVWQWLDPAESADVEVHGWSSAFVPRAWRRWLDARQAYADEVGQSVMQACGPTSRPTLERP
ncbi:hypothetical protein ACFY1C_20005 [Streptomyces sp. NPDC001279]|uniref:hypothetical protein n=1 Tax=Streptomyces sp. NPDC001279 TaxID=3364556 RepID=UPI00369C8EC1